MTWLFLGLWAALAVLAVLMLAAAPTTERVSNGTVVWTVAGAGVAAGLLTLLIAGLISII